MKPQQTPFTNLKRIFLKFFNFFLVKPKKWLTAFSYTISSSYYLRFGHKDGQTDTNKAHRENY